MRRTRLSSSPKKVLRKKIEEPSELVEVTTAHPNKTKGSNRKKYRKPRRNAKQIGTAFERHVCKALSLWISNKKRSDIFWRSAMSGGRFTVFAKKKDGGRVKNQAGDVSAIDRLGHQFIDMFVVECKAYDNLRLTNLIYGNLGAVVAMWNKVREEALTADKMPMIVMKEKSKRPLVGFCSRGVLALNPEMVDKRIAIFPKNNLNLFLLSDFVLYADNKLFTDDVP